MAKKIIFDPELQEKLRTGSETVCRTVQGNFGPAGRNTVRDRKFDLPLVANTGRRILQDFSVADPAENLSAVLVREAALRVASECGDGSIAATVLCNALVSSGGRLIAAGYEPMLLREGIRRALPLVRGLLAEITVSLDEVGVGKLAASVSKNDEVAANVEKAFRFVGTDGVITVQDTQLRETVLNYWDGARYDYGLFGRGFINDVENRRAVLTEPYVLLSNVKIKSLPDIRRILEDVIRSQASLLIVASDISEDVLQLLAANVSRGLKVAAVKAPGYAEERRRNMLSLAAKIGSLLFDENTGRQMKDCGLEVCAQISRAEADKDSTVLQGFRDPSEEMTAILRSHTLRQLEKATDPDEREKLQTTLSILNGKTAEILVGAPIEYEMFEKKYLYENTVRCVRNTARTGLVPGAGNAYLYLAKKIRKECEVWAETEREGALCLCSALRSLVLQLADNAGENGAVILDRLEKTEDPFFGYDVLTGKFVDLKEQGILTPADTLEKTVKVAAETAAALWTTGAAVLET